MLYDVYFNLLSFYLGLCTGFAHATKAEGEWHAFGIAIGTLIVVSFWWLLRRHLKSHAQSNEWSFFRRYVPLLCFVIGLALAIGPSVAQFLGLN